MTDTAAEHHPQTYRLDPRDRTGLIFGLSAVPVTIFGTAVVVAVLLVAEAGLPVPLGLLAVVIGAVVAFTRRHGEPAVTVAKRNVAFHLKRDHHEWVRPVSLLDRSQRAALALPPGLQGLVLLPVRGDEMGVKGLVGVVWDKVFGRYSAAVRVSGDNFALVDGGQQERLLSLFGEALAPLCRERAGLVDARWSEWAVPAGTNEHLAYLNERAKLVDAEGEDDNIALAQQAYHHALALSGPSSVRHEVVMSLSVLGAKVKPQRRHRGDRQAAAIETLIAQMRTFTARLGAANLDVSPLLTPGEVVVAIRCRLDPLGTPMLDLRAMAREGNRELSAVQCAPLTFDKDKEWARYGGSWHRTFWIAEWPRRKVSASFLSGLLLDGSATRNVSVLYLPRTSSESASSVRKQSTKMESERRGRRKHGLFESDDIRREEQAVREREQEITSGHPELAYVGVVDVVGRDEDDLGRACERIVAAASSCGCELAPLDYRHHLAVPCCLPVARGLRPEWTRR